MDPSFFGKCFDWLLEALEWSLAPGGKFSRRLRPLFGVDTRQELLPVVSQLPTCSTPCENECSSSSQNLGAVERETFAVEKEGNRINREYKNLPLSQISFSYGTMVNLAFPGLQCVHLNPSGAPIFIINDFLSAQECAMMIDKATYELVGSCFTGEGVRTSRHVRVVKTETPQLQQRIANLTNHQVANMESIKIIKYEEGEEFSKHYDSSSAATQSHSMVSLSGQSLPLHTNRELTLFVYLNDVANGGNTTFYADEWQLEPVLQVRPVQGMAVLFWVSAQPPNGSLPIDDGTWDTNTTQGCMLPYHTMHASLPAVDIKFLMTQWIWPIDVDRDSSLPNALSSVESRPTDGKVF